MPPREAAVSEAGALRLSLPRQPQPSRVAGSTKGP